MKKNLLIVGEKSFYSVFAAMFENVYTTHWDAASPDALKTAGARPIHLIICPVKIKNESSFDFLARLRGLPGRARNIPAVVLSSTVSSDLIRRSHSISACEVMKLPVEPLSFEKQIATILANNAGAYEKPDALTGLHKKRYAEEQIAEMLADGKKGSLFLIDLDHYSFASSGISDKALLTVRDIIQAKIDDSYVLAVASAGGFVLFAPNMKQQQDIEDYASVIIAEIKSKIKSEEIFVSMGLAVTERHGNNYAQLFQYCDRGLERARGLGKNVACFYQW